MRFLQRRRITTLPLPKQGGRGKDYGPSSISPALPGAAKGFDLRLRGLEFAGWHEAPENFSLSL